MNSLRDIPRTLNLACWTLTSPRIKKAYRRKALELHPDRNINNVAIATEKFAQVQAAYEILSDPQERAWYDSHRDAILNGDDSYDSDGPSTAFHNVRLTSTAEIMNLIRKFNATVPFNDEPTGFYGIVRETFEHLALEEQAAADFDGTDCPDLFTFGSSDDEYDPTVKDFYNSWASFSTKKSFSWKDKYRLSDAPDRRVRRLMEKENKKIRDDAIREFNDAVRFLVKFVRKRDPRYLPNTQTDIDRQKSMREAAAAQAARSRMAHQEKMAAFKLPDWAHSREDNNEEGEFSDSVEESEVEVLECVVCNKTFKSDKQLEAHEKSKKHTKAVRQLRHQMRKEGAELDLDLDEDGTNRENEADDFEGASVKPTASLDPETPHPNHGDMEQDGTQAFDAPNNQDSRAASSSSSQVSDDEYASRSDVLDRLATNDESAPHLQEMELSGVLEQASLDDNSSEKKQGKAKAKRAKKAAAAANDASSNETVRALTHFKRPIVHSGQ